MLDPLPAEAACRRDAATVFSAGAYHTASIFSTNVHLPHLIPREWEEEFTPKRNNKVPHCAASNLRGQQSVVTPWSETGRKGFKWDSSMMKLKNLSHVT
jgi:hypothetical protein